jgi:hypothetical protein
MKLILTFMFMAFAFAFMVQTSDISNERGESEKLTLMDIILSVLSNPEYLALSNKQKLDVLIVMYDILEGHLKKQGLIGEPMR